MCNNEDLNDTLKQILVEIKAMRFILENKQDIVRYESTKEPEEIIKNLAEVRIKLKNLSDILGIKGLDVEKDKTEEAR